jgi:predicted RNA-binding Zn-ribbon protein involved in translation (DUF1610 family)
MPIVNKYKCNKCDFSMPGGWGGYQYVESKEGKRIECIHPVEEETIEEVLGEEKDNLELRKKRVGFNSYCLCLQCLQQFEADLRDEFSNSWRFHYNSPSGHIILNSIKKLVSINEMCIPNHVWKKMTKEWAKDERKCPSCGSNNIKTELELVGESCPMCREGLIEEIPTCIQC